MDQYKFIQKGDLEDTTEDIAHQSLVKRSRRVLGEGGLGEAPPKQGPSESSSPSAAPSKRREQVRQAQRTHRQRTQTYMKSLEKEVLRLRTAETESIAKIEQLQHQVDLLLSTLVENHIPVPPGVVDEALLTLNSPRHSGPRGLNQIILDPQDQSSLVSLGFQSGTADILSSSSQIKEAQTIAATVEPPLPTGDEVSLSSSAPPRATTFDENAQPSILHDPQVGIDFVLALERPCFAHLRDSHLDHIIEHEEGSAHTHLTSGHIFTASLSLWRPTYSSRTKKETYNISAAELNRLLQCSLNIPVDSNEITPVQIWNRLQSFSLPSDLQVDLLAKLAEELVKHVQCLHFGAVVNMDTLNSILGRFFPSFSAAE